MRNETPAREGTAVLDRSGLDAPMLELVRRGYQVIGPRVRDGAIVYDRVSSTADRPEGRTDDQAPGHYRLVKRGDRALFGYTVGPNAWKQFLNPPRQLVFRARRDGSGFQLDRPAPPASQVK